MWRVIRQLNGRCRIGDKEVQILCYTDDAVCVQKNENDLIKHLELNRKTI